MDDVVSPPPAVARKTPSLRRRKSFATSLVVPAKLTTSHHSTSFPSATTVAAANSTTTSASSSSTSSTQSFATADLEFISNNTKPLSYISIRDLLPTPTLAAVQSPTPSSSSNGQSVYEISIRNRLVKQAAWAYLQPMSTSSESSGRNFINRIWIDPVVALFRFIARSFHWMLRAVRVRKR